MHRQLGQMLFRSLELMLHDDITYRDLLFGRMQYKVFRQVYTKGYKG
jgi:hypothetical protein